MLTLPEGLTSIGDNAFNGIESLKGVSASDDGTVAEDGKNKLPSTVTNIGSGAFENTGLKSPAGEKDSETGIVSGGLFDRIENNPDNEGLTIGEGAFAGTNVGPAVSLPDNTVSVGDGAFAGISNADGTKPGTIDVKVPAQLTGDPDGDSVKEGLAGIFTDEGNKNVAIGNLTVTASEKENGKAVDLINPADESAFDITVDKVILEEGLTSIEDGAFADTDVKEVATLDKENGTSPVTDGVLPGSLENIGKDAFADTELSSPAGVIDENGNISGGLFDRIEKDEKNNGLTIGEGAFANTNVGPVVNIPSNTASVGDGAFSGINGTDGSDISGLNVKAPAKLTADPNGDKDNGLVEIFINPDSEAGADDTPVVIDNLIVSGDDTEKGVSDTLGKLTNDDGKDGDVDLILGNVVLEEGVTAVGDNAFSGVGVEDGNSLTVTLPESADKPFTAIGENAFNGGPLAVDSEGKVVESDPVADLVVGKEDEDGTFVEKLPSTVTEIGSGAFLDSGLGKNDENGGLGGTITGEGTPDADITGGFLGDIEGEFSIGENAFGNTNIGPTINIPEGTTSVGDGAFAGITPENEDGNGGINVKVPSAITGDHDKNGDGIKEEGCLSDIFIDKNDETTKPVVIDNLIVTGNKDSEDDVVGAIADPATDPSSEGVDVILGNVVIDKNVDTVGDNAFTGVGVTGDDYILSVDLPEEGLTTIGDSAFENAPLPVDQDGQLITDGSVDGVLDITTGGESGKLPSTVTEIGNNAFKDSGLGKGEEDINIGGTYNPETGEFADGILSNLGNNGTADVSIGAGAFENTNIGPTLNIPENVTSIGDGAFAGITPDGGESGLNVKVPATITGDHDKDGNGSEESGSLADIFTPSTEDPTGPVHIGNLVITPTEDNTVVGKLEDENSVDLVIDDVVIEDDITEIGDNAFSGVEVVDDEDDTLTVTLPDTLDKIGSGAFQNTPQISGDKGTGNLVISGGKLPSSVTEIGEDAFKDSGLGNGDENIGGTYDPDKGIVTGGILADLEDTAIGSGAFENTNIGPVVNIPEGVTSIGDGAFAGITPNKTTDPESGGLVVQIPDDLVNGNETGKGIDDYFTTTGSEVPVEFDEIIITGGNIDKLVTDEGKISVDSIVINPENNEDIVISDDAFIGLTVPENDEGEKVLTVTLPDDFDGSITVPSIDPGELGFDVVFKQGDETFGEIVSYTVVYKVGDVEVLREDPVSYFAGLGTYKLPTENAYMSDMTYTAGGASVADGDLIALKENHEVVATGTSQKISITVNGKVVDADFGKPISECADGSYIVSASDSLTGKVTDKVSSEEGFTGPKYVIPGLDKIYTVHNVTVEGGEYAEAGSVADLSGWYIEGSDISSSIKGVTSSTDGLDFNSWVATTGTTEGGKITGNVTLTPNWKYDITVNNGTSSSTVTAYIGPKDSSGNYTQADLKAAVDKLINPAGSQFGLVAEDSSSVLKSEPSVPSGNASLTPSDVIDKELNVYYQFNAVLNTGVSAAVSGTSTAVNNGDYVEQGTTVTINSSNAPAGWTPVSDNVVKDGKKVSNTITVNNSSSVSGNYYPLYQKKVTVQGGTGEKTVEYSPNTSYQGSKFSDIIPASSDGAVYAVGNSDKLASSSSIINRDDNITPDNLTDNIISKYYNISVYPDNGKGGYYKDGSTSISGITSGFSYYYVSASPVSGKVSGPSNDASVSSGTKYIYQIHKIDFVTDTAKGTLNGGNTEYYTHGSTVSKTVTPKDGFEFASWNPGFAAVTGDATYTARYSWNITVSIYKNGELQTTTTHKVTDGGTYPATGHEVTGSDYVFSSDSTYKPGNAVTGSEKNFVYSYFTVGASTDPSDPAQQGYVYERDGHYYQLYLIGPYHRLGTSKTEVTGLLNDARTELDKRGLNGNAWNLADEALIRYLHNNDSYRTSIQNWMDSVKGSGGPYIDNAYENIWIKESVDSQYYDTTKQPGYTLVKYAFFDALKGADNLIPCTSSSYYINGPGNKNMDDTDHAYKLVLMVRQIN